MDLKTRNDAQLFFAKLVMYTGFSWLGFLVVSIITIVGAIYKTPPKKEWSWH